MQGLCPQPLSYGHRWTRALALCPYLPNPAYATRTFTICKGLTLSPSPMDTERLELWPIDYTLPARALQWLDLHKCPHSMPRSSQEQSLHNSASSLSYFAQSSTAGSSSLISSPHREQLQPLQSFFWLDLYQTSSTRPPYSKPGRARLLASFAIAMLSELLPGTSAGFGLFCQLCATRRLSATSLSPWSPSPKNSLVPP